MSIQQTDQGSSPSTDQRPSARRRKRIAVKLGIACLAIFLVGYVVMAAMEKIQDMTDRAH